MSDPRSSPPTPAVGLALQVIASSRRQRTAVDQLVATLMLEARALDAMAFQLTRLRLLLLAGRRRFLARASDELAQLVDELRALEVLRAIATNELAARHGVPTDAALAELAAAVSNAADRSALERCRLRLAQAMSEVMSHRDQALAAMDALGGHEPGSQQLR